MLVSRLHMTVIHITWITLLLSMVTLITYECPAAQAKRAHRFPIVEEHKSCNC